MEKVKNKWRNFKLLWQLVHEYKKTMLLWILVKIFVSSFVPFVQLLTMAKVIQWLGDGMSVKQFIQNLMLWMLADSANYLRSILKQYIRLFFRNV